MVIPLLLLIVVCLFPGGRSLVKSILGLFLVLLMLGLAHGP